MEDNKMDSISKITNKELMAQARNLLKGKWRLVIGAYVVYILVSCTPQIIPDIGWIIGMIISGPMLVGLTFFSLSLIRKKEAKISQIFTGFKKFRISLSAYLLQCMFIMLWSLLLIIPGILAGLSYSMTFFIIADDNTVGPLEALSRSKKMMHGNRLKLVYLGYRFIGWALLSILTFGIGFLWMFPYAFITFSLFYEDLKKANSESINPQIDT
jgi:uncharacterized membrane protein